MATKRTASDILAEQHWKRRMIKEDTAKNLQPEAETTLHANNPSEVDMNSPPDGSVSDVSRASEAETAALSMVTMSRDSEPEIADGENQVIPSKDISEQIDGKQLIYQVEQNSAQSISEDANYVIVHSEDINGKETQIIMVRPENVSGDVTPESIENLAVAEVTNQEESNNQASILQEVTADHVSSAQHPNDGISEGSHFTEQISNLLQAAIYHVEENVYQPQTENQSTATEYQIVCDNTTEPQENYVILQQPTNQDKRMEDTSCSLGDTPCAGEGSEPVGNSYTEQLSDSSNKNILFANETKQPKEESSQSQEGYYEAISCSDDRSAEQLFYQESPQAQLESTGHSQSQYNSTQATHSDTNPHVYQQDTLPTGQSVDLGNLSAQGPLPENGANFYTPQNSQFNQNMQQVAVQNSSLPHPESSVIPFAERTENHHIHQPQMNQLSSTPIQTINQLPYVQHGTNTHHPLPSPVINPHAVPGHRLQTPQYQPIQPKPPLPHYPEAMPESLFNPGEFMQGGNPDQGYHKPLPELHLHHSDLSGPDSAKENYYMTPNVVSQHPNYPVRSPYMGSMNSPGQYWSPPGRSPICSSKPYGPPRHYRPAPYAFPTCHCNSPSSAPQCRGYHMGHGHPPSGQRHPRSFNSSFTEYGCNGEPKGHSRRSSSCCHLSHSDYSSEGSLLQDGQSSPGMTPVLRTQNLQGRQQIGDFSQEASRFHTQMMRSRGWNSPPNFEDPRKISAAQPGLGDKSEDEFDSPKLRIPNSLSNPNNPALANLPPPGLDRTRYLVSTYIDYLVEENENITDMSKAFTPPTYLYLEEEEYVREAHKEYAPFPSNRFTKFIKQYFPQVDAISVPEGKTKEDGPNINQLRLSEKSFDEYAHTVFFGCQDKQEKNKSLPVHLPATFNAPMPPTAVASN